MNNRPIAAQTTQNGITIVSPVGVLIGFQPTEKGAWENATRRIGVDEAMMKEMGYYAVSATLSIAQNKTNQSPGTVSEKSK